MPPKKRALADADSNAQRAAKRSSTGGKSRTKDDSPENEKRDESERGVSDKDDSDIANRPAYTYITTHRLPWTTADDEEDDDDEGDDDNEEEDNSDPKEMWNKLASEHPEWQYVMMAETWRQLCDYIRFGTYRNPDNFGMYVYNDFHAYGVVELIENLLIEFNKAHNKNDLSEMWRIVSTLGHWLNHGSTEVWLQSDDGERTEQIFGVVGSALLTALETIDRAGELKTDSTYRDLGLVMAVSTKCAIFPAEIPLEEGLEWRPHVFAYAKKADIDLAKVGCDGIDKALKEFKDVKALDSQRTGDRWEWKKKFKDLAPEGGQYYDITKWSRQERAEAAFDKVDPLKDIPAKVLREGGIVLS